MPAKYMTITLDETVVKKLDWILENSVQPSKSGCISGLIESEYLRLMKRKQEALVDAG